MAGLLRSLLWKQFSLLVIWLLVSYTADLLANAAATLPACLLPISDLCIVSIYLSSYSARLIIVGHHSY